MIGEQTNYIWGVVDLTPDTDFPDIRNKTAIHSNNGSCMIIPREGDKVRLYIQLDDQHSSEFVNDAGRIDKEKVTPEILLEVGNKALRWKLSFVFTTFTQNQIARKSLYPYTIKTPNVFEWWTIYISK